MMRRPRCFCSPGVRQDADGARQDEKPASKLGLEAELAEDDGGDAVDVHRYQPALARFQRRFDRASDARVSSADHPATFRAGDERVQRRDARIDGMKAVAETRHDLLPCSLVPFDRSSPAACTRSPDTPASTSISR